MRGRRRGIRKDDERREVGRKRVAEWEKNASKAKL